jgi:hypothetical protein
MLFVLPLLYSRGSDISGLPVVAALPVFIIIYPIVWRIFRNVQDKKGPQKKLAAQDFEFSGLIFWNTTIKTEPSIIITMLRFCEIVRLSNSNGLSSRNISIKNRVIP